MTFYFFFCQDCKTYVSAGDQWASAYLVAKGIVKKGSIVDKEAVWDAEGYWDPPREPRFQWLYEEVLPSVSQFLLEHVSHRIVFGTRDDYLPDYSEDILEWLQVGYMAQPKPRFLVEVLGFRRWDQVQEYMDEYEQRHGRLPYWYWSSLADPSELEKWKQGFEKRVGQSGS